jgi:hypothetical protein
MRKLFSSLKQNLFDLHRNSLSLSYNLQSDIALKPARTPARPLPLHGLLAAAGCVLSGAGRCLVRSSGVDSGIRAVLLWDVKLDLEP